MGPSEHANNQELLANLTGSSVAAALMKQYGGLTDLAQASFDELQHVKGIGQSKAAAIKSAFLLAQRLTRESYPERFAQEALGHNSKAVHRAYAKRAVVKVPSLEEYEQQGAEDKEIPFPLNPNLVLTLPPQGDRPTAEALYKTPVFGPAAPTSGRS